MAEYGELSEVVAEVRGSFLAADASISDTELLVEYAGDFDPEGGTLDLNGTRIEYTALVDGVNADDPDTVTLLAPLAVAADEGDTVSVVIGGQVAVDYFAHVGTDDGDQVSIPIRYDQIAGWPVGIYDPPVPVSFSEDHEHLEDAPGRTPLGRVSAWNIDEATAAVDDADVEILLTYKAALRSILVHKGGLALAPNEWTYDGAKTITVSPSDEVIIRAGQRFVAYYDRDEADDALASPLVNPIEWGSTGPSKIVAEGNMTDYSAFAYDDSLWSLTAAPLGFPTGSIPGMGAWPADWGPAVTSTVTSDTGFWLRRHFTLTRDATVEVSGRADGQFWFYLDGDLLDSYTGSSSNAWEPTATVGLAAGPHVIALHVNDDTPDGGAGDYVYGDVQVVLA